MSIRKRTLPTSGESRWQVDYIDSGGVRRARQFKTKRDATDYETKVRHEIATGVHTADSVSITVAEAAELWLKRADGKGREMSTLKQYDSHVRLHITPYLGAVKLTRLTCPMVESFVDQLTDDERTPAMVKKILVSLRGIISEAQRRGLIAQNVAREVRVTISSRDKQEVAIPDRADIRALIEGASGRFRPLLIALVFTGMRVSEVRALAWDGVDFKAGVIRVTRRADRYGRIGATKTRAGRREIPMAPFLANTLKEWRLASPPTESGLVFPTDAGTPIGYEALLDRDFRPLQTRTGVVTAGGNPRYGFHALRHYAASVFIDMGVNEKRLTSIMGHASITTTMDVYGHLLMDRKSDDDMMRGFESRILG